MQTSFLNFFGRHIIPGLFAGAMFNPGMVKSVGNGELTKIRQRIEEQIYHDISNELHDNIGQILSLVKININSIDVSNPDTTRKKLFQSECLIARVIGEIRNITKKLNPEFIQKVGFVSAIEEQIQFLNQVGLLAVHFCVKGKIVKLDSFRELMIFRVIQELLNNIVKHSEATKVLLTMDYQPRKLIITVRDNGIGFDISRNYLHRKGCGLMNIRDRISLVNGGLHIESERQKGTTVCIEVANQSSDNS